jgi:kynurenine 3-monooxygenase
MCGSNCLPRALRSSIKTKKRIRNGNSLMSSGIEEDLGPAGVAVVGGGLVGCLLGVYLRKHGMNVTIYESRADPRLKEETGRSINLIMSSRGIHALTSVDESLAARVMAVTTKVTGRTLHTGKDTVSYQAYGPDASYCNFSVSRWELNKVLMDAAQEAGCRIVFNHPIAHVDIPSGTLYFYLHDPSTSQLYQKVVVAAHIFGCDGGGSRVRQALEGFLKSPRRSDNLGYGYKELKMPRLDSGQPALHNLSLHIWPRGNHFMMGLANKDGSFTMTLYMPCKGPLSFESVCADSEAAEAFFREHYSSAVPLMPNFKEALMKNPVGFLGTVYTQPWHYKDKVCLLGDASHAITPFFGQGCNSGFEDISVLHHLLQRLSCAEPRTPGGRIDMTAVFDALYAERKPNTDAIAAMALENFTEMMDKVADSRFQLEKKIEIQLSQRLGLSFISRYALITHSLVPYSHCQAVGKEQQSILSVLSEGKMNEDDVDYTLAAKLVEERLTPLMLKLGITADNAVYTSEYYK